MKKIKRNPLEGKNITVGVTGSIAAYKSADLVSKLVQVGANVSVIMSKNAENFVGKNTFEALSHNPVITNYFENFSDMSITSRLITRFLFPTPAIKARDQAVRMRHRNKDSDK